MGDPRPRKTEAAAPSDGAADAAKPHFHGHRQRLRARLLEGGTEAMPDYEILEFLLFSARPQGDTKPLAKDLLKRFGNLGAVLSADAESLRAVKGMGEASVATLKAVREVPHGAVPVTVQRRMERTLA